MDEGEDNHDTPARNDAARSAPPLYGLVLAGGRSSRMGTDKAALRLNGESQVRCLCRTLAPHCRQVFVSVRPEQRNDAVFEGLPLIEDRYRKIGPLAGLLSAFDRHPDAAWFVAAVDMPDTEAAARRLADHRCPDRIATAPFDPENGVLQPLFTIYEPSIRGILLDALREGRFGLRRILEGLGGLAICRIVDTDGSSFRDIDTIEEMHAHIREERP